jgi:hypothetical protein
MEVFPSHWRSLFVAGPTDLKDGLIVQNGNEPLFQ